MVAPPLTGIPVQALLKHEGGLEAPVLHPRLSWGALLLQEQGARSLPWPCSTREVEVWHRPHRLLCQPLLSQHLPQQVMWLKQSGRADVFLPEPLPLPQSVVASSTNNLPPYHRRTPTLPRTPSTFCSLRSSPTPMTPLSVAASELFPPTRPTLCR